MGHEPGIHREVFHTPHFGALRYTLGLPDKVNETAMVETTRVQDFPRIPVYVIHSEDDELFPIAEVRDTVALLMESGGDITFTSIRGPTHFDMSGFIPALRATDQWLRTHWEQSGERGGCGGEDQLR